jgi:predicted metal-dependent RNase
VEYARSVAGQAKKVILVHGEEQAAEKLQEKLSRIDNMPPIYFPDRLDTFEL